MIEVKFTLEKRKNKETDQLIVINVPIKLDFSFNGQRFEYYTGIRIPNALNWDDGRVRDKDGNIVGNKRIHEGKAKRNTAQGNDINDDLTEIKAEAIRLYKEAVALKRPLTLEYFRNGLKAFQQREEKNDEGVLYVTDYFKKFIDSKKISKAENTIKKYTTTKNHFDDFIGKKKISFYDVSVPFLEDFKKYIIYECGEKKNGTFHNTTVKYTKTFVEFLKWAAKMGYNKNAEFLNFELEGEKEPAIIYLEYEEIERLKKMELKDNAFVQLRDVFLFGCYTGQRYSCYRNLKKNHIIKRVIDGKEKLIWINNPVKSRNPQPIHIPLNDFAESIIRKYADLDGEFALPVTCNQTFNKQIKKLGKLAQLDEIVTIYKFKGSKRIEEQFPKYKKLSTHTMRKTFISNAFHLGMDTKMVKKFTNHKSDKDFDRYLGIPTGDKMKAIEKFDLTMN